MFRYSEHAAQTTEQEREERGRRDRSERSEEGGRGEGVAPRGGSEGVSRREGRGVTKGVRCSNQPS